MIRDEKIQKKRLGFLSRRKTSSAIKQFAQSHNLVYFGSVGQFGNEHHVVRGMTVSVHHKDSHYCVGTYQGYDVNFVERTDIIPHPKTRKPLAHQWHIFEFDLIMAHDLPHIFVGMHSHSESFYMQLFTKFPHLRSITLGALQAHTAEFLHKYRVYGNVSETIAIEHILSPLVTELVTKHFGALAIEIHGSSLFIYSEHHHVSEQLLDAMIKNGRWLADHIDRQADAG